MLLWSITFGKKFTNHSPKITHTFNQNYYFVLSNIWNFRPWKLNRINIAWCFKYFSPFHQPQNHWQWTHHRFQSTVYSFTILKHDFAQVFLMLRFRMRKRRKRTTILTFWSLRRNLSPCDNIRRHKRPEYTRLRIIYY